MSVPEADPKLASEVARQRKMTLQYRARANWAPGASILAGFGVGVASWFIRYQRPMDYLDLKCSLGFGLAAFFVGILLFRKLFPNPNAKCPRCGYAWEIPGIGGHDWLTWKCCPGCGLKMTDDTERMLPRKSSLNGTMVAGVILNVLGWFVLAAAHYGRPSLLLLLGISAVISLAGLIVSALSRSEAGPILVMIGCVFFLPLGLIAGLGAQMALNAMKRAAALRPHTYSP
jgi:hypothetical protein